MPRKSNIIKYQDSPSEKAMERTYNRATLNGGVTQDFSANVENIREISRKLSYNILSDASFVYVPSSYGESKNFAQVQNKRNLLLNSTTGTTQNVTTTAQQYTLQLKGTGTYTLSGTFSGSLVGTGVSNLVKLTFTPTAGTLTLTVSGSITEVQLETGAYATPYQKTVAAGDGIVDFNFTRATSATVTNKQGVIEDSCYNLLQRSEDLGNGYWIKPNYTSTINAINSPIGTNNGFKLTEGSANGSRYITPSAFINQIKGTYTFSIYAKYSGRSFLRLWIYDGSTDASFGYFDILNGVVGSGTNSTRIITSIGNGWFLCSITGNITTGASITPACTAVSSDGGSVSFQGDSVSGVYLWGAQLVQGSTPRPYLRTTNRLNVPKLDYSRGIGEPELLIEPQSTNLFLQSEDLSSDLTLQNATVSLNTTISPGNISNADRLIESNTTSTHDAYRAFSSTSGTSYTLSVYVKKYTAQTNENRYYYQNYQTNADAQGVYGIVVDLLNGTMTSTSTHVGGGAALTNTSYVIVDVGLFFRISITATINYTGTSYCVLNLVNTGLPTFAATGSVTYTGNGLNYNTIWGKQFEVGSRATTYIPTTTATVTRNAENNYVDLFNNAALSKTNWTLFYEGYLYDGQTTGMSLCLSDTSTAASNTNQIGWTGAIQPFYNVGNVRTNGGASSVNNTFNRFAIQQNNGVVNFFSNGIKVWQNASVAPFDYRYLTLNSGGSTYTTDKLALFNRTLTDTECITLTNNTSVTFNSFDSTWNTNNTSAGSTAVNQVKLPLVSTGSYAMSVDWGDGTTSGIGVWNQAETTHTYATAGTYQIKITGTCNGWAFSNTGDRLKFTSVQKWGDFKLGNSGNYFYGCANLNLSSVSDVLNLSGTTIFAGMFNSCTSLTTVNRILEWNTSSVTSVSSMFAFASLNQNLDGWNLSSCTDFTSMFQSASAFNNGLASGVTGTMTWVLNTTSNIVMLNAFKICPTFNQNVGGWNVSKVISFNGLFNGATAFNNGGSSSINNWALNTTSNVDMGAMFAATSFNQPIINWNTSKVTNAGFMFQNATAFNQNLSGLNLPICTDFSSMFSGATTFNNGLASGVSGSMAWTINSTTPVTMANMFNNASAFNADISSWNISKVTNMSGMFAVASKFNQNLSNWERVGSSLSSVTTMNAMFQSAVLFNGALNNWNLSSVTDFNLMFNGCSNFNNSLASGISGVMFWVINTTGTVNFGGLFNGASKFNQDISSWNVSRVNAMNQMFQSASLFNQDISSWDVSNVISMSIMFNNAPAFNQNIGTWNVSLVTNFTNFMAGKTPATFSTANLDAIYNGWSSRPVKTPITITFGTAKYTAGSSAGRAILTGAPNNWNVIDGGL